MNEILAIALLFTVYITVENREFHDVIWNSNYFNEVYRHTSLKVRLGDQLTIICPKSWHKDFHYEYAQLYWVSEEGWSNCWQHKPRWVGVCVDERATTTIKLTFRSVNPIPGGMEFHVGKTYYIISTSDGDLENIERRAGGLCESKRMKLSITVHGEQIQYNNTDPSKRNGMDNVHYEVQEYQQQLGMLFSK
uniref:Ephrin RBD domain-containing protein n=1 Tax=Caenorhabditis tropicalis TaxID=1561998 RepID=A0A1I7T7A4_9PELO